MKHINAMNAAGALLVAGLLAGAPATTAAGQKAWIQSNNPGPVEYCKSAANSTGHVSGAMVIGNLRVSDNETWLHSYSCPPNTFGVFLMGRSRGFLPFGNGYLCISPFESPIHRVGQPALTDDFGNSFLHLNMESGQVGDRIVPGSTWNFQCYYRDLDAGGAGFNLSSAVTATFVH